MSKRRKPPRPKGVSGNPLKRAAVAAERARVERQARTAALRRIADEMNEARLEGNVAVTDELLDELVRERGWKRGEMEHFKEGPWRYDPAGDKFVQPFDVDF